jgi:hypothetical protein
MAQVDRVFEVVEWTAVAASETTVRSAAMKMQRMQRRFAEHSRWRGKQAVNLHRHRNSEWSKKERWEWLAIPLLLWLQDCSAARKEWVTMSEGRMPFGEKV